MPIVNEDDQSGVAVVQLSVYVPNITLTFDNGTGLTQSGSNLSFYRVGRKLFVNGYVGFTGTGTDTGALKLKFNENGVPLLLGAVSEGAVRMERVDVFASTGGVDSVSDGILFFTENSGAVSVTYKGSDFGNSSSTKIRFVYLRSMIIDIASWAGTEFTGNGSGLATNVKPGLLTHESVVTKNTNVGGATTSPSISVKQARVGALVNLTVSPSGLITKNATGGFISFPIDAAYTPAVSLYKTNYGIVNGSAVAALWIIGSNGTVSMYAAGGASIPANTPSIGWDAYIDFSYQI